MNSLEFLLRSEWAKKINNAIAKVRPDTGDHDRLVSTGHSPIVGLAWKRRIERSPQRIPLPIAFRIRWVHAICHAGLAGQLNETKQACRAVIGFPYRSFRGVIP